MFGVWKCVVPVVTNADLIMAGDQSGWSDFSNAATPDTWGHAIDVPDMILYEFFTAAKMLDPGAAISGCSNEKHS